MLKPPFMYFIWNNKLIEMELYAISYDKFRCIIPKDKIIQVNTEINNGLLSQSEPTK